MKTISKQSLYFILLLLGYFIFQFQDLLFRMPSGIHEWAQGDRLSLAYGFYDNGLNFLKPATLSQFSTDGIVGVEFPIQAYITAALAKIFGKAHIVLIFRLLDTLIVGICLFILFKIASGFTRNFWLAALPATVLLVSPSFLDYTCNFMPDPVAAAIVSVGLGFYLQCWLQDRPRRRYIALLCCILATLIKTSCGVYLIGVLLFDTYLLVTRFKSRRMLKTNLIIFYYLLAFAGFAIIYFYYQYNKYLNEKYDSSLFLLNIRPMDKASLFSFLGSRLPKSWMKEYFIIPAYFFFAFAFIPLYFKKVKYKKEIMVFLGILFSGILGISYLLGAQFTDHDYYIIPIFFPFLVLHAFWFVIYIESSSVKFYSNKVFLATMTGLLLSISYFKTQQRLSPDYPGFSDYYNTKWMSNGAAVLDSLGISNQTHIGILNESPPNLSLLHFNRKGYAINKAWWVERFESASEFFDQRGLKYGICKLSEFNRIILSDASYSDYFHTIYANNNFIVFTVK